MSENNQIEIEVNSKHSLIHIGSLDSFDITEGGKTAAKCILDYFTTNDDIYLKRAIDIYDEIIPNENFGGEYTALQWICRLLIAPPKHRDEFLSHPMVESWFDYLSKDDFKQLKEYLNMKYHFINISQNDDLSRENLRFLEDFILFNNPDRERWEKTSENLYRLNAQKGFTIADVGSGPGYFSFKFADIVGETGKVYAIETNPLHLDYLNEYIKKYSIKNVEIINSGLESIGLHPSVKVDMVYMCSLYHVIYAALTEDERMKFINSTINCLKEDGRLVIVDNDLVKDTDLPYHGPYIDRSLIISQLWYHGLELVENFQFTPQRYVLVFEKHINPKYIKQDISDSSFKVPVNSMASLVNFKIANAAPTAGFTNKGQTTAKMFYEALQNISIERIQDVAKIYKDLSRTERIGDEYTAFVWFCNYITSDNNIRKHMISDPLSNEYFENLCADNFLVLKKYLNAKYELGYSNEVMENLMEISEYINFNNPNRDSWEKTNKMLDFLKIKKDECIADIGCGSGFFTYQFAKAVHGGGHVYATEINKEPLIYVDKLKEKYNLPITTIQSALNDTFLPEKSVDTIFMCSMYHAVYIASIEFVKDSFIDSLKNALKKNGRLIIVDNEIYQEGIPTYYGSAISRDLIISQLKYYGFDLIVSHQYIPQRYILIFKESILS